MVPVLAEMEMAGIRIDSRASKRMSNAFAQKMAALEDGYTPAGGPFNVGSPKQLGEILFDKMGLAGGKAGQDQGVSTSAEVLEDLAAEGHDLPARVLDWRQLSKLKSTYTDALPTFVNPETGRVHTSYSIAGAQTGAAGLDRSEPAKHPRPDRRGPPHPRGFCRYAGAPAGQPRLQPDRAAHPCACRRDPGAETGVPRRHRHSRHDRQPDVRRAGRGHGPDDPPPRQGDQFRRDLRHPGFGLARNLRIPRAEAQAFIDTYFERFPEIRAYMDRTAAEAKANGFVRTLFGRRINDAGDQPDRPGGGRRETRGDQRPIQGRRPISSAAP